MLFDNNDNDVDVNNADDSVNFFLLSLSSVLWLGFFARLYVCHVLKYFYFIFCRPFFIHTSFVGAAVAAAVCCSLLQQRFVCSYFI